MPANPKPTVKQKAPYPNDQPHKKAPGQWGLARELGCCRGTYPPPAAEYTKERKSRWRREKGNLRRRLLMVSV